MEPSTVATDATTPTSRDPLPGSTDSSAAGGGSVASPMFPPGIPRFNPRHLRPLFWRLPLLALLAIGLVTVVYVDRVLQRDYQKEASTQAVQTDALLESFVTHRLFAIGTLRALLADSPSEREQRDRFAIFSREIVENAPDLESIALLDAFGVERETYRRSGGGTVARDGRGQHVRVPQRAGALARARAEARMTLSGTLRLDDGRPGMIGYLPIERNDRVIGFLAAGIPYQALFDDALAGQLQGIFPYRIVDERGVPIAVSADFPDLPARLVTRAVTAPGELSWTLQVAIGAFEPRLPRFVNVVVGPLLLLLVLFLVLREEARARRFGEHTLDLEIMSSNLLAANVRLEERAHQIAEANAAKSRFLANVSHELRTPINAIVGYNSLALEGMYGALAAGLRTAHERMHSAADHLLKLVDDVLDLSKIEVGRLALDLEPVDVGALLEGVSTVMQPLADSRELELSTQIDVDLPTITSDGSRIRQIVLNLTSNAIKFTERGSVTLSARRDPHDPEGHVLVEVRDTGIGIARRDLGRIFEEFEQVRPSGRGDSMQRGTGLGLAISKKLSRLLGGDLRVYSRPRRGSIFTLLLPVTAPDVSASGEGPPQTGSKERERPIATERLDVEETTPITQAAQTAARLDHSSTHG